MILAPAGATTVIGAAAGAPATFCIRTCTGTGTGAEDDDVGALMVRSTPSSFDARTPATRFGLTNFSRIDGSSFENDEKGGTKYTHLESR